MLELECEVITMKLKELRLKAGFTQKECAAFLNISLRKYSDYENETIRIDSSKYELYRNQLLNYLNEDLNNPISHNEIRFLTNVKIQNQLDGFSRLVAKYKRRKCFSEITKYLYDDNFSKVLILYGLRRTGKTTLIR